MEVTRKNFDEVLSHLRESIKRASFVSIDAEYSGLRIDNFPALTKHETVESLYRMDKQKIESFLAIQYGIVLFYYNDSKKSFSYEAFCFYVYPSTYKKGNNFLADKKSLKLLAEHGFDFNKLLREGIPYLKKSELEWAIKAAKNNLERDNGIKKVNVPQFLKKDLEKCESDLRNGLKCGLNEITLPRQKLSDQIIIQRALMSMKSNLFFTINDDETMTVYINLNNRQYHDKIVKQFEKERQKIIDDIGFSKVINLLIQNKTLIVGHNVLKDIMFTINQFIEDLPESVYKFIVLVHNYFPNILDTKHLAHMYLQDIDSNLYILYNHLKTSGNIPMVTEEMAGHGFGQDESKCHNSAYDAYITGLCFLAICNIEDKSGKSLGNLHKHVAVRDTINQVSTPVHSTQFISLDSYLKSYHFDRSNVFHVTFPKEWMISNLKKAFDPIFIEIVWINNTSAYVCVNQNDLTAAKAAIKTLNVECQVKSFDEYHGVKQMDEYELTQFNTCFKKVNIDDTGEFFNMTVEPKF
ncbi:UNVERIFIED_CONTAM: hypothetical protein PYX00_000164 [Menopon gallinae]|uniref:Poly(A)-specific ribonuclease RNA-binding domain-containing protein n=1 Tax=Menopon gallinae TaxID=328185 RepID=A0AAW2I839_9NEOP